MNFILNLPEGRGILEGAPFSILIKGKTKDNLRKALIITGILWVVYSLFVYSFQLNDHIFFTILLFLSFLVSQDKALHIYGLHGNWKISMYYFNRFGGVNIRSYKANEISSEFRITGRRISHGALIILKDSSERQINSIIVRNIDAKNVKDDFDAINIPILLRKRIKKPT